MKPIFGGEGEDIAEYWRFEVRGLGNRRHAFLFLLVGCIYPDDWTDQCLVSFVECIKLGSWAMS